MTDSNRRIRAVSIDPSHSPSGVSRVRVTGVVVFVAFSQGEGKVFAQNGRDTTACAPTVALATGTEPPIATHSAQGWVQFLVVSATSQHVATHQLFAPDGGRSTQGTAPVLQSSDRVGKLRGRIWDLGGRPMHRDRSLPASLPRARGGLRLQPVPAAAPTDQPYHPDSSRLVCCLRSGPVRAGTPPSHQDPGVRNPSVLALIRAFDAVVRCTLGFARRPLIVVKVLVLPLGDSKDKTWVCARRTVFCLPPSVLSSRFSQARCSAVLCLLVPLMPWKRKRCWSADALCPLDSSVTPQYDSELDLGSPEALIPPRGGIQRRRQTVLTAISASGDHLRAQPVPTKPARESSVAQDSGGHRGVLASFICRGRLSFRTRRPEGRCKDGISRTDHADHPFDVALVFFVLSASQDEVRLHGPRRHEETWSHRGKVGCPAVKTQRSARKDTRLQPWSESIRDLASRPLSDGFVRTLSLLLFASSASQRILPMVLGSFFSHHSLMHTSRGAGCPIFAITATLLLPLRHFFPILPSQIPILTGQEPIEAAMINKSTTGGWDGWAWNEIEALSLSWLIGPPQFFDTFGPSGGGHRAFLRPISL